MRRQAAALHAGRVVSPQAVRTGEALRCTLASARPGSGPAPQSGGHLAGCHDLGGCEVHTGVCPARQRPTTPSRWSPLRPWSLERLRAAGWGVPGQAVAPGLHMVGPGAGPGPAPGATDTEPTCSARSMPIFMVDVELAHVPHAPCSRRGGQHGRARHSTARHSTAPVLAGSAHLPGHAGSVSAGAATQRPSQLATQIQSPHRCIEIDAISLAEYR